MDSNDQQNNSSSTRPSQQQEEDDTTVTTDDLGASAQQQPEEPEEIELSKLEECVRFASLQIRKQLEPIYQLTVIRDCLRDAIRTDRMGKDEQFAKYVNDTLGMRIVPTMSKERSVDNEYLNICADILEVWINLFLQQGRHRRFNDNFMCALTWCFQPNTTLHNLHFEFSRDELKQIALQHQTWRRDVQIGEQLDVQVTSDLRIKGWMLGTVTQIVDDHIKVEFPDSPPEYDKVVDRWSTNIAPAGQKTSIDMEWRKEKLSNCVNYEVDVYDGRNWHQATIFETKKDLKDEGREVEIAYVAYRIYRDNPSTGMKNKCDQRGYFEGYSSKYDEFVPIISPHIKPFGTMTGNVRQPMNEVNDDHELDDHIKPSHGFQRVYAVPRIATCLSKKFLYFMDYFGNQGGFDLLLDILENCKLDEGGLTLTACGYMITLISMPSKLWHRDFITQYGARFCKAIEKRFLDSEDVKIRDVDNSCTYQAIWATNMIKERLMARDQARKEMEVFKLKFIKKCLESQFLEKRIQGIKDLNEIVNDTIIKSDPQQTQEMIDWILNNQVFTLIWDSKKTHVQLVQRSGDIFRCFLKEDLLTEELLTMFWNLTKSDYKQEIYKILNDCEYYLEQAQIEYIFNQITETQAVKLDIEELDILSMLGRRGKLIEFSNRVSFYFWSIIQDSQAYEQEFLDSCVEKFAEMIKYWSINLKKPFFQQLATFMASSSAPTIPIVRLFQQIITDHKDREMITARTIAQNNINQRNYGNVSKLASPQSNFQPVECRQVFDELEETSDFSNAILRNLAAYFKTIQNQTIEADTPRKKIKLANSKYLHYEEVDERLKFLQTFAANSSFEITKVHLKTVYELLSGSPVKSDLEEFLKWCKNACENITDRIVDLNEVGEFFKEQISQRILDLKSMPATGFHFIQMFFVSSNIDHNQILRVKPPKKEKKKKKFANSGYGNYWDEPEKEKIEEDPDKDKEKAYFIVMEDPNELQHLDMIWSIVLESEIVEVYENAIDLLVYSYLSIDTTHNAEEKRSSYAQSLINKCFDLIKPEANPTKHIVGRVTDIIKETIKQSEKSGTVDIRPHNSILKGELIDRVLIKSMSPKNVFGDEKVEREIVIKLYTSCTLWELKKELSSLLALSTKYLELEFPGKKILDERDHGIDMRQLGLKKNDIIKVRKVQLNENIPEAELVDEERQWLVPRAEQIFTEWFNMFKNPIKDKMDNFSVARFIMKSTKVGCHSSDTMVTNIIQQYDTDNDGMLTLQNFLQFYYDAASDTQSDRRQACFRNLKNLNVRPDLVKLSEVKDFALFSSKQMMPRFALQANEHHYQILWQLLERGDETCAGTWELIRMLATNEKQYMEVIRMNNVTDEGGDVDWKAFFQGKNAYQRIYMQEIILSELEDSEQSGEDVKRVMFVQELKSQSVGYQQQTTTQEESKDTQAAAAPDKNVIQDEMMDEEEMKKKAELQALRLNWSRDFLERGGFQFILSQIYSLDVENGDRRQTEFMLTLVRVFLIAAFATDQNKDIGQAVKLARKSSSIDGQEDLDKQMKKPEKKDKLQELLHGELGMEILLSTNYSRLQQKILQLIFLIVRQTKMSLEDKLIVENAISVWVGICLYKSELFDEFLSFKSGDSTAQDFILAGLVFCSEDKIRSDFYHGIRSLAKSFDQKKKQDILNYFMGILGQNFQQISEKTCGQYFDLFASLLDHSALQGGLFDELSDQQTGMQTKYEPEALLAQIIDKIIASQQTPDKNDEEQQSLDEVASTMIAANKERWLVGLITLTRKILQNTDQEVSDKIIQEKNLINLIFQQFLFVSYFKAQEEKNSDAPKKEIALVQRKGSKSGTSKSVVSNSQSRQAAFCLLIELVKKSDQLMQNFIQMVLMPMLDSVEKPRGWGYTPPSKEGGEGRVQEYVGLRNLGCICYMNSMMQQFFMVPAFRYNLLCVEDGKDPEPAEYRGRICDDNMFHQMQRMFTNLELSERTDYNPFGFCFAFKEYDGSPTNTAEQKDAQEFLNILFDRLETALKPTSRKYLLEGIFGGKQCSQMVCTECGKVKNRHEDFLSLSLNIKDIKSVYQALQKLIEGEIINDYQCDGCNRKVDLSRRTLIAETPNILIVHLQRIGFNFETFETDKVNTLCKFPTLLDLKPYSYFDVMEKEGLLKKKQATDGDSAEKMGQAEKLQQQNEEEMLTEEELKKKKEAEEETREPVHEDCFEYKLVGVNVHSGTANMGHYWSYINTNRGHDEQEGDKNWIRTDLDPWMEFNDSRVSDFDFKELEKHCFGNESGSGFMGDSYGTSGYMLFYERRKKKDLKIVIEEEKVEEEQKKGFEVKYDEEKKEHFKMVPYREAANGEKAIPMYQQVFEDNQNVNFENDIYSAEFFDFILQIMKGIAGLESTDSKELGLKIGKKVGFDILARCFDNSGLTQLGPAMIDILKSSDEACLEFMQALLDDDDAETVMEILFDCTDRLARKNLIRIIRYLICRLKDIEKEKIIANEFDIVTETYTTYNGESGTRQHREPRSLVLRFMLLLRCVMKTRAARSWKIIDTYMEVFFSFGLQSAQDVESEIGMKQPWNRESNGYQIGMMELCRSDFLVQLGDFVLQDNSPLYSATDFRVQMGNYYIQPDFDKALYLITILMSDNDMLARYPLSDEAIRISQSKAILQQLIKASEATTYGQPSVDFSEMLNMMCMNNYNNTKKLAKAYVTDVVNKTQIDDIQKGLKSIRGFLLIKDGLRQHRFEWIFGIGQIYSKRNAQATRRIEIGVNAIEYINQDAFNFKSGIVKHMGDALLTEMIKYQKTKSEFTIYALNELVSLCLEDDEICEYIYNQPPPTYQYARYTDWFESFCVEQRNQLIEQSQRYTTYQDMQSKESIAVLTQILSSLPEFEKKCAILKEKWIQARASADPSDFDGYKSVSMAGTNEEVIDHYPPQYIVGQPIEEIEFYVQEDDLVTVRLFKVTSEYMFSNPTGKFNLSLPEKKLRNTMQFNSRDREKSYAQWKREQMSGQVDEFRNQDQDRVNQDENDVDNVEEENFEGLDVRQWHDHSLVGEVMIRVNVENTCGEQVKVEIGITPDESSNEPLNCKLPVTNYFTQIFAKGMSVRPVMALIHKIDPSKPFGKFNVQIKAKRMRSAFSGVGRGYGNLDMANQNVYREVVSQISNGNFAVKRQGVGNVGFFVTNNPGLNLPSSNEIQRRRNGVNLGDIQNRAENENDADGEVAEDEDGQKSFGSNVCDPENYIQGSDLESDLQEQDEP